MKVCVVSDSHDNRPLLASAVAEAKALGARAVFHCGDVVAPTTLRVLQPFGLPVHVIHGNNMGDTYATFMLAQEPNSVVHYHGQDAGLEIAGRRIFLVHYPHYAHALALTGEWDMICFGHDHRPAIETCAHAKGGGQTLLVNPGTVAGVGPAPTYAFGDLESMVFEIRPVPGIE